MSKQIEGFQMIDIAGGNDNFIMVQCLIRHYTITNVSNSTNHSHKAIMVLLYRFIYIKSYRCFLFQRYNSEKIVFYVQYSPLCLTCKCRSHDKMASVNEMGRIS